jgi:16S rRNA pseudouridine516 synthase
MRIDKYLADAGMGTRSQIKDFIKKGFVTINGAPIKKPDIQISASNDVIVFRGEVIQVEEYEYYILNKPKGYVSATKDNTAPTVLSLIDSRRTDLFPVGRLDKDTEGLLLITNDGGLSHKLLSPKHHVDKTYYAIVEGKVDDTDIQKFKEGLFIGDEDLDTALPAILSIVEDYDAGQNYSYVNVTIQEGKFHQVKRMFQAVNKKVIYLKRISFGGLSLPDNLDIGKSRALTGEELSLLKGEL